MDSNWFFSSFCQSAAALIGIIGAFVISRLLGIRDRANVVISDFDHLIIEFNELILKINSRHFFWFTKTHVKYNSKLRELVSAGSFDNLDEKEIIDRVLGLDDRLFKIDAAIMEGFNDVYNKFKPNYTDLGNGFSMKNTFPILDLPPKGIWRDLEAEQDEINKLKIQSQILIQKFNKNSHDLKSFEDSINSLKTVILFLMIIFLLTVIYPLHFMPVSVDSSVNITINIMEIFKSLFTLKIILLSLFLFSIEGIFYYFLTLIKSLKKDLKSIEDYNSDDLKDIKRYSVYFD